MATAQASPGASLFKLWQRLAPWPGGRWLFGRIIGRMSPYTGSISPRVRELRPGYARIELRDRRRLHNPFNSIHAIALANLGEVASGLALAVVLPTGMRGIPTRISTEYFKKARGLLVAESHCDAPPVRSEDYEYEVQTEIRDGEGDVVARMTAWWRLGPVP